jgi:hypothetical protein
MAFSQNLDDYLATLEMSQIRHLLVEGVTDKKLFEKLFERFFYSDGSCSLKIDIDIAEDLDISSQFGNRGKVEEVCRAISADPGLKSCQFAGFVDREFREFDCRGIRDLLERHNVIDRLVWSRGHSVENYLFTPSIFSELFSDTLDIPWLTDSLVIFHEIFDSIIRLSCAVGLAAYDLKLMQAIRSRGFSRDLFSIKDTSGVLSLEIDTELWRNKLQRNFEGFDATPMIRQYLEYFSKVASADMETVKWLCDGHLGFKFILFGYCQCISYIYRKEPIEAKLDTLLGNILALEGGKNRFLCGNWWSRQAEAKKCIYPIDLFKLLQVD